MTAETNDELQAHRKQTHPLSQALINDLAAKFGSEVLAAYQQGALDALRKVLTVEFSFGDRTGWLDDIADEYGGWGEDGE